MREPPPLPARPTNRQQPDVVTQLRLRGIPARPVGGAPVLAAGQHHGLRQARFVDIPEFPVSLKRTARAAINELKAVAAIALTQGTRFADGLAAQGRAVRELRDQRLAADPHAKTPNIDVQRSLTAATHDTVNRNNAASQALASGYEALEAKYGELHELLDEPIPLARPERAAYFDKMRTLERELRDASTALLEGPVAQAEETLSQLKHKYVHHGLTELGDDRRDARRLIPATQKLLDRVKSRADEHSLLTGTAAHREELEGVIDEFEARHGTRALSSVLGDGKMTGRLGMEALRVGEPLSRELAEAVTDPKKIGLQTRLGAGAYNAVKMAPIVTEDGGRELCALKPLGIEGQAADPDAIEDDGRRGVVVARQWAFPGAQTGVFGRQQAAHKISEALGLEVARAPKYVLVDGKLHMATPMAKGDDAAKAHRQLATPDVVRLHANPSFQRACQELQLFQSIIGNYDGNSTNVKISMTLDGERVAPSDIAAMSDEDVARLEVKLGAFDFDFAFPADPDIQARIEADGNQMVAGRSNDIGPPPFHTERQHQALLALRDNLDRELGESLSFAITSDDADLHQATNHTELSALKVRVDRMLLLFEDQYRKGARLNEAGQVCDFRTKQATGEPNQEWRLAQLARPQITYTPEGDNFMRGAVTHKLFPIPNGTR